VLLFFATLGLTVSFGLLEVGYPGYATWLAVPALGGVLLSVNSLGSAIGGAIFGGLHLRASMERQFAATMGLMAVPLFLHAVVDPPILWGIVAFFAGAFIAPAIASQSTLVSRLAPSKYATEAFMWSSTFIVTGLGAGMALGGTLIETTGVKSAFVTAGLVACAMALLALLLPVRRVEAPSPVPAE
jgi:predicted MFS family arabinose efflux permease